MRSLSSCVALIIIVGSAAVVKTLKSALAQAKERARVSKAAADLKAEQVTRRQYEERVTEVEQ